ncbi:glycosyltransferase family 2 protein [Pseudophaeobacter sp. EL27]|uniref:glycosyltransferase family 2 protein n=1 Tax=Pseudophaeobacter sp. EL27 TaxID=2107580 RepID=UPI000EFAB269|nr:glycosyltransferase family 2 protein [Pseudophaeobacter sp. EL27]
MRIYLHIGLEHTGADRLQKIMADKRDQLRSKGVLFPRSPGSKNHTRLFMAVTDPDHVDPLRYNRGYITAEKQNRLYQTLEQELQQEVTQAKPDILILSASQLGSKLHRQSELERLKALLAPLSDDIQVVAHIDTPARALVHHYGSQILEGRDRSLSQELDLCAGSNWWSAALQTCPPMDPQAGQFEETQGAPFWLDYPALQAHWEAVFGVGCFSFRPYDEDAVYGAEAPSEICTAFGIASQIGRSPLGKVPQHPSASWLARSRQLNILLLQLLAQRSKILPRQLWRSFLNEIAIEGAPIDPATLAPVSRFFAAANQDLAKRHPALKAAKFGTDEPATGETADKAASWQEAAPERGFRASQYLLTFMRRINKATKEEMEGKGSDLQGMTKAKAPQQETPTATALKVMTPRALENFEMLQGSPFKPHNNLGQKGEDLPQPPYSEIQPRQLPEGSSGNVIVGCMKNEAPYILEWVAYHRAMGVDNFLIYTNGCEDGTSEILDRLQEMGLLQHRNNDDWKGNSPQQHALNQSLKEPVIRDADWIIHIDVDEFMNVRCGNGTLQDLFDRVPDASNIAMTWRLFGSNDVISLKDEFVTGQFDACAPKHCPKPHTVWGFKTMFKNIGAYQKISCHRPNKLEEEFRSKVKWVNGSGKDMTSEAADNGWRNSRKSIGYDLIQLNHYALRSAESFLVKRQRGRALHVDRSIGINYWIRMDWNDHRDVTIQRNQPRLQAEYDRLMQDDQLRDWHQKGLEWHRAKADELHGMEEFEELYQQALTLKLTATERVAYALALDVES